MTLAKLAAIDRLARIVLAQDSSDLGPAPAEREGVQVGSGQQPQLFGNTSALQCPLRVGCGCHCGELLCQLLAGPKQTPAAWRRTMSRRSDANNHANQLNSNNPAYHSSREGNGGVEVSQPPATQPPVEAEPVVAAPVSPKKP